MLKQKLKCVLLIDDDEATNFLNARLLKKAKVAENIQIAENGLEALNFLTCKGDFAHQTEFPKPDLIFLDINMPVMDGWEFLTAYNNLEQAKGKLVVIMLTTSLSLRDELDSQKKEIIKSFINKPLNKTTIQKILKENFAELWIEE